MLRIIRNLFFGAVLGIIAGIASVAYFAGLAPGAEERGERVLIDGWQANWAIGTEQTDPYIRLWVARYGLFALRRSEAVYFITAQDRDGRALRESCIYMVRGGTHPGDWWSVTLYDADGFLPLNVDERLSVNSDMVAAGSDWSFTIAPTRPDDDDGLWVSSKGGGDFNLTLRIYRPHTAFLENPEAILNPPMVERVSCVDDGEGDSDDA